MVSIHTLGGWCDIYSLECVVCVSTDQLLATLFLSNSHTYHNARK